MVNRNNIKQNNYFQALEAWVPESELPLGILSTNGSFWISKIRGGLTNDFDEEFNLETITLQALELQMFQGAVPLRILLITNQAATHRSAQASAALSVD